MDKSKIIGKDIKLIFEKMEYAEVLESTNLAKAFLQEQKKEIFTYINKKNEGCKGSSEAIKDVYSGECLCTVFSPEKSDVDKIILNTKQNNSWCSIKPEQKAILINRLAEEIQKKSAIFCQLEISLRGILSIDSKKKALPLLVEYLQYYSSWAADTELIDNSTPKVAVSFVDNSSFIGFLGCIIGPALAAGYNLIIQTAATITPLVFLIIELAESIGIPKGTLKLLPGKVDAVPIFQNENVNLISMFGNYNIDVSIPREKTFLAITNSKSSMIIFNSADIDAACDSVVDAAWAYQGLLPWSVNTLLVQEDIINTVTEKLKYRLGKIKIASATDKTADISFPTNINANTQLLALINEAKSQGIEVFQNTEKSNIFQPTLIVGGKVFSNNVIKADDNTAVISILAFRTANEAINLANNTRYGFAASIWTENIGLANEVARGLNVGNVWINSHGCFTAAIAFSPRKKSGYGTFGGAEGYHEFKSIAVNPTVTSSFTMGNLILPGSAPQESISTSDVGSLHSMVMLAKKGYQSWSKMTVLSRGQFLRTLANQLSNNISQQSKSLNSQPENIQELIKLMYLLPTRLLTGTSTIHSTFNIQSHCDAVGVIVIEASDTITDVSLQTILGSILLGNAVIVLCFSFQTTQFYMALSKIMNQCKITPGVFIVIPNCDNSIIKASISDREIDLYIESARSTISPKIEHMQRFYNGTMEWRGLFNCVTIIKNVWYNVGDSIV